MDFTEFAKNLKNAALVVKNNGDILYYNEEFSKLFAIVDKKNVKDILPFAKKIKLVNKIKNSIKNQKIQILSHTEIDDFVIAINKRKKSFDLTIFPFEEFSVLIFDITIKKKRKEISNEKFNVEDFCLSSQVLDASILTNRLLEFSKRYAYVYKFLQQSRDKLIDLLNDHIENIFFKKIKKLFSPDSMMFFIHNIKENIYELVKKDSTYDKNYIEIFRIMPDDKLRKTLYSGHNVKPVIFNKDEIASFVLRAYNKHINIKSNLLIALPLYFNSEKPIALLLIQFKSKKKLTKRENEVLNRLYLHFSVFFQAILLEQHYESLATFMEHLLFMASSAVLIVNSEGVIVFANKAFEQTYGDWHNKKCYNLIYGLSHVCPECPLDKGFSTYNKIGQDRFNNYINIDAVKISLYKEKKEFLLVVIRDITNIVMLEKKQKEYSKHLKELVNEKTKALIMANEKLNNMLQKQKELNLELEKSKLLYEAIVEDQVELISIFDREHNLVFANNAFCEFFGMDKTEVLGKSYLFFILEEDVKLVKADLVKLEMGKIGDVIEIQHRTRTKSGEIKWLSSIVRKILPFGKLDRYQVVSLDKTKEKEAEIKLAEQNRLIENAERLSMLGQMSASIIHEINTPLTYIRSNAELIGIYLSNMNKKFGASIDPEIQNYLYRIDETQKLIFDGTTRIMQIASGIRSFIKDEQVKKMTNIVDLIENVLSILYAKWDGKIKIIKNFEEKLPLVNIIPGQIEQVLINLLLNAFYAVANRVNKVVLIKVNVEGNNLLIEIEDNGVGIKKQNLKKIFSPLYTTKVNEGTGLGLSIVKKIIDAHNGKIEVSSRINKGTKFVIRLPIKENMGKEGNNNV